MVREGDQEERRGEGRNERRKANRRGRERERGSGVEETMKKDFVKFWKPIRLVHRSWALE